MPHPSSEHGNDVDFDIASALLCKVEEVAVRVLVAPGRLRLSPRG